MQRSKLTKSVGAEAGKRKKMALGKGLAALIPDIETEHKNKKDFFYKGGGSFAISRKIQNDRTARFGWELGFYHNIFINTLITLL